MKPFPRQLPDGLIEEHPPFVPRMVMADELKAALREVGRQWEHRDAFGGLLKYGIRPLDRMLFYGPPGNGKTLTCYYLSKTLGIPIFRVLCNQLRGKYLGETARNVAGVLDFLNNTTTPCLCLFDEVESIFVDRQKSSGQCDREVAAAMTIMMQSLDRWRAPTLLVLATNIVGQIDEALLSRVELKLEFGGPTPEQTTELLNYWREILSDHGADEWGPALAARFAASPPGSFRALQQQVAWSAREWTARQIG